jgi:hypothetical protein
MKGIKFVLGVLVIGAVSSAPAQLLFTNLTLSSNSNLVSGAANNNLNAVAYNGTSNFLAVGANQVFVCGNFNSNQTWFAGSNWSSGHVLSATNGLSLDAVTLGNNLFVATGDKNAVFSVTNIFVQISGWTSNGNMFNNTAVSPGIAYNTGTYVGVSTAPVIGWTNAILSKTAFWPLATWQGQDVIESFRGVTAYGTYGANAAFAACGFYGDILTSSNGGSIWQPISGQSQAPPFYGIASDGGGQTLVSVGAASSSGGLIMIFTNRAQTFPSNGSYDTNFVTLTSGSQLNAVAYTGSGFMAVGNNGEVLTLTNSGGTWKTNGIYSPVNSAINLNGVAFATTGTMTGVGELVGNSGTLVLAGYAPQPPINPVSATNCAAYPAAADNGTLSVSVVTDANHPAGTVSVDWYYQTNLVASGTTSFTPTNNPNLVTSNAPVNYIFTAVERDLRTGFTSTGIQATLQINPRPTTTLAPLNTTDCNVGDAFVLTDVLTGIGPWMVSWNDGTIQTVSQSGPGPVILMRTVFPTNTTLNSAVTNIYYVTNVTSADTCLGNLPGDIIGTNTIVINPRPTATLMPFNFTDCNEGDSFPMNVTLTGLGPWTVYWNDGTVQSSVSANLTRVVFPTNSFGANFQSNNVYFVTVVSNNDTCRGNEPGDIIGTNTIVINPLPTATLVPLNATNCNDGTQVPLNVNLTGIGPWTVLWNDGTVQPSPIPFLTRIVSPTNMLANAASNNVYYVATVTDSTCVGNQPGDIAGTNSIVINPRPTATLAPLSITNCNNGSSFTLTDTLTGIGPWVLTWNDGVVQTNVSGILQRVVSPTNVLANAASNNTYYVTSLLDSTCVANEPGDITGTNLFIINPLPTVTLTISTNDFAVSTNGVGSGLLEMVSNPSGSTYNLTVGFQSVQNGSLNRLGSQTLGVTNHLAFSGIGPWTVILSDGSQLATNTFSSNGNYVWQETISTNNDTNFTFSVQSVQSTNTGCSAALATSYDVLVYDAPTAFVYPTNTVCGSATNTVTISAALGGFGPWTNVVWSDGFTNSLVTSSPFNRTVPTPTNGTLAQIITNYTIVSLTDMYGATTTSGNDLTGSGKVIVDPYSSTPPVAQSSLVSSCDTVSISLSVTVPGGFTANWFDANTNLLTNGVTAYLPPAPGVAATNIYLVAAIYNDTNLNDGCDSPFTVITNVFENCPSGASISLTGTNVVISWSGIFILQSATNLVPPITWMNEYTGALGPNFVTNSVSQPPIDFFRLAPTN